MQKPWFKRKLYGWGWYPSTWQGWVVMLVHVAGMVKIFRSIDMKSHSSSDTLISFALPFIAITIILIVICYAKGEKPRWQWGKRKE